MAKCLSVAQYRSIVENNTQPAIGFRFGSECSYQQFCQSKQYPAVSH